MGYQWPHKYDTGVDELCIDQTLSILAHYALDPAVLAEAAPTGDSEAGKLTFPPAYGIRNLEEFQEGTVTSNNQTHPQPHAPKGRTNVQKSCHIVWCPTTILPGLPLQRTTWADGHSKEPQPGSWQTADALCA